MQIKSIFDIVIDAVLRVALLILAIYIFWILVYSGHNSTVQTVKHAPITHTQPAYNPAVYDIAMWRNYYIHANNIRVSNAIHDVVLAKYGSVNTATMALNNRIFIDEMVRKHNGKYYNTEVMTAPNVLAMLGPGKLVPQIVLLDTNSNRIYLTTSSKIIQLN